MSNLDCIESALSCTGWNKARVRFLARFVLALLSAQTVCLWRLAPLFPSKASVASRFKRMQRFVRGFDPDMNGLAGLLAQVAGVPGPWVLSLDRTNWKLGKAELNVLMLCVVHQGVGFPLLWTVLHKEGRGKAGNSSTTERIALMTRFVETFGARSAQFVCADREFVSREWLAWLQEVGIGFRLRLRSEVLVSHKDELVCADGLFRHCAVGQERALGKRLVLGRQVWVTGTKLVSGDFLIVVADRAAGLGDYALRWGIETLFGAFKSRGFHLEDTHVTDPERLGRLVGLLSVAYCWAFAAGNWLCQTKPLTLKKHGRLPVSFVRRGLDFLRPIALRLCATDNNDDLQQALHFLSCT